VKKFDVYLDSRSVMRPSLLAILFAAMLPGIAAYSQPIVGVTNTLWRYYAQVEPPAADWALSSFDDSAWATGRGLFGHDTAVYPYPFNTLVPAPATGGPLTAYYRTRFQWTGSVTGLALVGTNHVDDGCVLYLNGVELCRFNMPGGPVDSSTLALLANPSGEPVSVQMAIPLDSLTNGNVNPLIPGENVIAVEVHQNTTSSSDHVYGLSLRAVHIFPCGIIQHPVSQVATACETATFTVVPHFECFTPWFQWFFVAPGGSQPVPIAGATQSTLVLTNVQPADIGSYFCQLTSVSGTIESQWASLEVHPNTNAPAIRYAYRDDNGYFHVLFARPIQMPGGENDPESWRVYQPSGSGTELTVTSARLTNDAEVVLQTAESTLPWATYAYATTREITPRCGEKALAAGATGYFGGMTRLIEVGDYQTWRYLDNGDDPGPGWQDLWFDDSYWKSGMQAFGTAASVNGFVVNSQLEVNYPGTNPAQRIPAYLFRLRLPVCDSFPYPGAIAQIMHDDGMILYLNGREVFRRGVADDQLASFGGSVQEPAITFQQPFFIDGTNFMPGRENVVAVLLKQANAQSSDAALGVRLSLIRGPGHVDWGPVIARQPESVRVVEGRRWSMQVVAGPCGPGTSHYQWYRNGVAIPGANFSTLTGIARATDAGVYYVVLNGFSFATSSNATLHVEPVTLSYRASWRYQTNSQDATLGSIGAPWFGTQFDDSSWPTGQAPFAREISPTTLARMPSPIATPLPAPEPNLQTLYFRTRVIVPEVPAGQTLVLCHTIDDGAAIYVDGQLAHRYNLTNALPIYSTNAAARNAPPDNDAQIVCTPLTLTQGEHLIAVEVHQANPDQSDVYFGLELRLATPPTDLAIKSNSVGNYFLQWTTDPFWDLMESTQITGPYSRVSGSGTSPYFLPPSSTNRFYRLLFHGR